MHQKDHSTPIGIRLGEKLARFDVLIMSYIRWFRWGGLNRKFEYNRTLNYFKINNLQRSALFGFPELGSLGQPRVELSR